VSEAADEIGPPLVTVIVTTYNHERFVSEALESVLRQEADFDFEVLVLDDCSTDATGSIIAAFERAHPDRLTARHAAVNVSQLLERIRGNPRW
jgi:glycosyltransferase involved in cell wall biosynthesis